MARLITTADEIVPVLDFLKNSEKRTALVLCISRGEERGYVVGIATENESGYKPTHYRVDIPQWDEASKVVDEANLRIFGREPKEDWMIIASTMRS